MDRRWLLIALAVVFIMSACVGTAQPASMPASASVAPTAGAASWGDPTAINVRTGRGGRYLTDAAGRALYAFDEDSTVSKCNGDCAATWPPFVVAGAPANPGPGVSKPIATAERANGSLQVTYGGSYLYYSASDTTAGDTKGDGVGGVWHLATP